MRKLFFLLFFFSVISANSQNLKVPFDWSLFKYDESHGLLECYYSLLTRDLVFEQSNSQYTATTVGELAIYEGDSLVNQFVWKRQIQQKELPDLKNPEEKIDQVNFKLNPGHYQCKFMIFDANKPANRDSTLFTLDVPVYGDSLLLSDIELSQFIQKPVKQSNSPFFKNHMIVTPNPSGYFGGHIPRLNYYIEVYHLDPSHRGEYFLQTDLMNKNSNAVIAHKTSPVIEKDSSLTISSQIGSIQLDSLQQGDYICQIQLLHNSRVILQRSKEFYLFESKVTNRMDQKNYNKQFEISAFSYLDSLDIANEYRYVSYLLDEDTKPVWDKCQSLDSKRHFLFDFWGSRSSDPNKLFNNRVEFLSAIRYANQQFHSFTKEGWISDRGRIYILYGAPDDIERFHNEAHYCPYEIWQYHGLQNGVVFIFADLEGRGDFELLHSTLVGEISNPNYMDIIESGIY